MFKKKIDRLGPAESVVFNNIGACTQHTSKKKKNKTNQWSG